MAARSAFPASTIALLDRAERGDLEAAYELARIYRPDDITDLITFVIPDGLPHTHVFDALADAYGLWLTAPR